MGDTIFVITLIIVGIIGAYIGLSANTSGLPVNLAVDPSGLFASVFASVETGWTSPIGQFLVTFDNFANTHQEILDEKTPLKVFDVESYLPYNMFWAGTDHGLFLSRDGGLTWDRFTSSNNEIDPNSTIFKVLPASGNGEDFFISVFSNGKGTVYRTWDYFFHLQKLMDFDNEAAYDIYRSGSNLYFAMSTGQIIRFDLLNGKSRVVNAFSSPVLKIRYSSDGNFYVLLRNGNLERGATLDSEFKEVNVPGNWLFGNTPVKNVAFDGSTVYILTNNGVQVSYDSGQKFELLKHIPILTKQVDALGAHNGILYVFSGHKLYISDDGGENWKIIQSDNQFQAFQFFFTGGRIIVSM